MNSGKAILILGGGVIGLCTAYYAQRSGHHVTVLERGAPTHDSCSLGNAGMITPSHIIPLAAPGMVEMGLKMMLDPESPFTMRLRPDADLLRWGWQFMRSATEEHVTRAAPLLRDLNLASRKYYEELAQAHGNDFGLVQKGLLMLCQTPETLAEEQHLAERANTLGVHADVLTPEAAAHLDPNVRMQIAGAVYFPLDCHLDPQRFVQGLTRQFLADGGVIRWETEATGWRIGRSGIEGVQTTQGDFTADEYVLAGGAWSSELLRSLGLRLPLQAGKGYSLTLTAPPQMPALCAIMVEARVAVTPMQDRLRFAGTMEVTGLDQSINPARVKGIIKSVSHYYPAFSAADFAGVPVWTGLRPCSPDGLPYIGRFTRYPNLSAATGHAMMGLSLGPVTGALMADVLSDRTPALDLSLLRPDRFA